MFDTSKPYGLIGGVFGIARFEQDGKYYDAQHNLLDNEGNPLKSKGKKADTSGNPPVGSTSENQTPSGQLVAGQTDGAKEAESGQQAPANTPAPAGGADEKATLVARAKELKIASPHLFGLDKLKAKIAEAEGALNSDAQLAANLGQ